MPHPDDFSVHVRIRHQFDDHRGQLVGAAQAVREQHGLAQLRLEGLGPLAFTVDGPIDEDGRDGIDPWIQNDERSRATGSVMPTTPPTDFAHNDACVSGRKYSAAEPANARTRDRPVLYSSPFDSEYVEPPRRGG
jgi:hypothetical protein